jgi:hypothetical protein
MPTFVLDQQHSASECRHVSSAAASWTSMTGRSWTGRSIGHASQPRHAACQRRRHRYEVAPLDIDLQADPSTSRLLAAYRRWATEPRPPEQLRFYRSCDDADAGAGARISSEFEQQQARRPMAGALQLPNREAEAARSRGRLALVPPASVRAVGDSTAPGKRSAMADVVDHLEGVRQITPDNRSYDFLPAN